MVNACPECRGTGGSSTDLCPHEGSERNEQVAGRRHHGRARLRAWVSIAAGLTFGLVVVAVGGKPASVYAWATALAIAGTGCVCWYTMPGFMGVDCPHCRTCTRCGARIRHGARGWRSSVIQTSLVVVHVMLVLLYVNYFSR